MKFNWELNHKLQRGVILLPVVLTITLVALASFLISRENANTLRINANQIERDGAEYLIETALNHVKWNLDQNTSCTGYGNLGSQGLSGHSYSATISPTSASPVTVNVSATLSNSNAFTRSFESPVYGAAVQTTLQSPVTSVEDSYVDLDNNGEVNSDSDKLKVQNEGGDTQYSVIRFDLGSLRDEPLKIKQARLQLLLTSNSSSAAISVHPVKSYWDNDFISWSDRLSSESWLQAGGDFDSDALDTTTVTTALQWYTWDVTSVTRAWLEGRLPNEGLLLKPESTSNTLEFHSSEASQATDRPLLLIDYVCECGQVCV